MNDSFTSQSYSNASTGSIAWSGAWIESDSAGAGPTAGNVQVNASSPDFRLRLGGTLILLYRVR